MRKEAYSCQVIAVIISKPSQAKFESIAPHKSLSKAWMQSNKRFPNYEPGNLPPLVQPP